MDDLQATVEISVDLGYFFNVDLFQRGFYQVVIEVNNSASTKSNLEVHVLKNTDSRCFSPATVNDHQGMSKTIQILHKHQKVLLDHTFLFRCHKLVDSRNLHSSINDMNFVLNVKLCFCSTDDEKDIATQGFEVVSRRTIVLRMDPLQGLHEYTLLVFDYGYMAGVEMVVHASLVALHQPLLSTLIACAAPGTSNVQTVTLETILFRPSTKRSVTVSDLADVLNEAGNVHNGIINVLFTIYSQLTDYLNEVLKQVPRKEKYTFEFSNSLEKIKAMKHSLAKFNNKEELLDQVNMNLASACSYVLALWSHTLEVVCLNRKILKKLSFSYHKQRTQRFQSFFFTVCNPRSLFDEQRYAVYNWIADEVRSSEYYKSVLPLSLESLENDGGSGAMPIIFEDKFEIDCHQNPIFKQRDGFIPIHKVTSLPSVLSTAKNAITDQIESKSTEGSPYKIPHLHDNTALEINSKCINEMASENSFFSSKLRFTNEICANTLEEPDDFPSYNPTVFPTKTTWTSISASGFDGPNYEGKKINEPSQDIISITSAFGSRNSHHNLPSLTTAMLSPADEPDVATPEKEIPQVIENGSDKICTSHSKPKKKHDDELLTLQAFLEEDFDLSQLHDIVCEPSIDLSPDAINEATNSCSDSYTNAHEVESFTNMVNSNKALMMEEIKHASEKSKLLGNLQYPGYLYCDLPFTVPLAPYLSSWKVKVNCYDTYSNDSHLIVLVHGLDGCSSDLRMVKTYLHLGLEAILKMSGKSNVRVSYLMSVANEKDTYDNLQIMTDRLVDEILSYIKSHYSSKNNPRRISFIGHSLGGLLIRSAITSEKLKHLQPQFHTFLSFSAPHLGLILNNSTLINTGLWLMQKWKKSACLRQLSCKEETNLRNTFIYKLSTKRGLDNFKNILLVASAEDRYVPYQSARIEMCKAAFKDKMLGSVYQEMINNIMSPILNNPDVNLLRYHVVHSLQSTTANSVIGRAAHIAVLDSEVFLEQFFLVAALQYFV